MSALHRLQHLRLTLAELSLTVLEEHCSEVKSQALSRESKTSAELALEEFTRSTPEPGSLEQVRVHLLYEFGQISSYGFST